MKTINTTLALILGVAILTGCGSKETKNGKGNCQGTKSQTECCANGESSTCEGHGTCTGHGTCEGADKQCSHTKTTTFMKKYTNADYYKDGVFQQDVAKKAYYEMFAHYGYPVTPMIEKEAWYTDFGLGDFENCGMGGIFWVNDKEHGYFAHDIYLLPGQMIPEHSHVKTDMPAKFESWMIRNGMCYNYTEVGAPTADAPKLPASQASTIKSKTFVKQEAGQIVHLAKEGTWHFLMAGENGAIVYEYANYHDGAGLRFTNPKAKL